MDAVPVRDEALRDSKSHRRRAHVVRLNPQDRPVAAFSRANSVSAIQGPRAAVESSPDLSRTTRCNHPEGGDFPSEGSLWAEVCHNTVKKLLDGLTIAPGAPSGKGSRAARATS
jgi:hypothetical protein